MQMNDDMNINSEYGSPYAEQSVPESGHIIEITNDNYEVNALTWVSDNMGYSMNGCFRVKDKQGTIHLVTKSQNSKTTPRWKTVS
jgi:hypothetical protein